MEYDGAVYVQTGENLVGNRCLVNQFTGKCTTEAAPFPPLDPYFVNFYNYNSVSWEIYHKFEYCKCGWEVNLNIDING